MARRSSIRCRYLDVSPRLPNTSTRCLFVYGTDAANAAAVVVARGNGAATVSTVVVTTSAKAGAESITAAAPWTCRSCTQSKLGEISAGTNRCGLDGALVAETYEFDLTSASCSWGRERLLPAAAAGAGAFFVTGAVLAAVGTALAFGAFAGAAVVTALVFGAATFFMASQQQQPGT